MFCVFPLPLSETVVLWPLLGDLRETKCNYHRSSGFDAAVIDVLPAIHTLIGCDTTSKFGTKLKALKTAISDCDLLKTFGKDQINDQMIADAEQFLVKCISSSKCVHKCFDVVRYETFHNNKFAFDHKKLPASYSTYCGLFYNAKCG